MRHSGLRRCLVLVCLAAALPLFAAEVKKRSGEKAKGSILGIVVQELKPPAPVKSGDGYGASYMLTNGKDVESIDTAGVRFREGALRAHLIVSTPAAADPGQILRTYFEARFPAGEEVVPQLDGQGGFILTKRAAQGERALLSMLDVPGGGTIMYSGTMTTVKGTATEPLLGQYRDGKLAASVRVATSKGNVEVSVEEIAAPAK